MRRPGLARWLIVGTLLLMSGALLNAGAAPQPVLPSDLELIDPAVRELVRSVADEVAAEPGSGELHGKLGMVYEANLLWEPARHAYANAAALDPDNLLWRYHLALGVRQVGQFEEAVRQLRAIVASAPDFAPAQQRLGLALLETGDLEGALAALRRVVELEPDAAQGYAGVGQVLLRQRDAAAAATYLEAALVRSPHYRSAHYQLGLAYQALGRDEAARLELARGVDARVSYLPDALQAEIQEFAVNHTAQNDLAVAYLRRNRPGAAAAVLESSLAYDPDNVTTLNNLAIAYLHQGRLEEARQTLERARRLDDRRLSTYINLTSWAQRSKQPDLALEYAAAAVERGPGVARAWVTQAQALARLGRTEDAVRSLQRALRLDARDLQVRMGLASLEESLGRPERALEQYQEIGAIWPDLLAAHLGAARIALQLGQLESAEAALSLARQVAPDQPQVKQMTEQLRATDGAIP